MKAKRVTVEWRLRQVYHGWHSLSADKSWSSYFTVKGRPIKFTRGRARVKVAKLRRTAAWVRPAGRRRIRMFEFRMI